MQTRRPSALLGIRILCWFLLLPGISARNDTIPDLSKQTKAADWLKLPNGKAVWVEMHDSADESDEVVMHSDELESTRKRNPLSCVTPDFAGIVRKNAKTTPHRGCAKVFCTLDKLTKWLPTDSIMAQHQPRISSASDSKRVAEERQNVKVRRAYLLAAYREQDNDFHVVLCDRPKYDPQSLLFSIEVSGLPKEGEVSRRAYRKLTKARRSLISRLGDIGCGKTFIIREGGIPVRVKGSLFFDSHHVGQIHGRQGLNPPSAWEIHPVTSFKWLD